MDRAADLRSDYERLGKLLGTVRDGSKAAALARERRMIGEVLEAIEAPEGEVSVVDELAARRRTGTEDLGPSSRRRRSGGG